MRKNKAWQIWCGVSDVRERALPKSRRKLLLVQCMVDWFRAWKGKICVIFSRLGKLYPRSGRASALCGEGWCLKSGG